MHAAIAVAAHPEPPSRTPRPPHRPCSWGSCAPLCATCSAATALRCGSSPTACWAWRAARWGWNWIDGSCWRAARRRWGRYTRVGGVRGAGGWGWGLGAERAECAATRRWRTCCRVGRPWANASPTTRHCWSCVQWWITTPTSCPARSSGCLGWRGAKTTCDKLCGGSCRHGFGGEGPGAAWPGGGGGGGGGARERLEGSA